MVRIYVVPMTCYTEQRAARMVTNETYRYLSSPRFHPSKSSLLASKWYTATVTIGAPEIWEYPVQSRPSPSASAPDIGSQPFIPVGSGKRLVSRNLPRGFDRPKDYEESQVGPEQPIWYTSDSLIYARNVRDKYKIDQAGSGIFGAYLIDVYDYPTNKYHRCAFRNLGTVHAKSHDCDRTTDC